MIDVSLSSRNKKSEWRAVLAARSGAWSGPRCFGVPHATPRRQPSSQRTHRPPRPDPRLHHCPAVPAGGLRARSVDSSRGRRVDIRFSVLVVPRCRRRRHVRRGTPARRAGEFSVLRGRQGGVAGRGECDRRLFGRHISMPVRTGSPVAAVDNNSTICNGGQPLVGAPGSHHPRLGAGSMCPMVPHLHNDPFYCSPFGNPYYR